MIRIVLIGASGSGKSTFAAKHFRPTEILSSDFFRGLVADDPNDQGATKDAFDALHFIARKRLAAGRLAVIDATLNVVHFRIPRDDRARSQIIIVMISVSVIKVKMIIMVKKISTAQPNFADNAWRGRNSHRRREARTRDQR